MADDQCPYCGEPQEINHDDGYGYSEDEIYQQQCWSCERNYTFQTSIVFYYDLAKAPCLNGSDHDFQPTFTVPVEYTKMECATCGERRAATEAEIDTARQHHADIRARSTPPNPAGG